MNFTFLIIIVLLILLYLTKQLNGEYRYIPFLFLIFSLLIYEIYMYIGNKKIEKFQTKIIEFRNDVTENHDKCLGNIRETTISIDMSSNVVYLCCQNLYNLDIGSKKDGEVELFLSNYLLSDKSRSINILNSDLNNDSVISIKNEFEQNIEHSFYNTRYMLSSCSNDDYVYYIGGCRLNDISRDNLNVSDTISIYDKKWKIWTKEKLSKPRYLMNSISIRKNLPVVLSQITTSPVTELPQTTSPVTELPQTTSPVTELPQTTEQSIFENNIYQNYFIFGLKDNNQISKTIDIYENGDINSPSIKSIKVEFKPRIYMKVHFINNKLYLIGGSEGNNFVKKINIYDTKLEAWQTLTIPYDVNVETIDTCYIENKLYMIFSNKLNYRYYNKNLRFNLLEKAYDVNNDLNYEEHTSFDLYGNQIIKENSYNKVLLDSWVHIIYDNILYNEKQNYSITFWINIPEENKDKTLLILGDYNMCNNRQDYSSFNGLILHENKLLPCFHLDGRILIKNQNVRPIEYNKWIHVVFSVIYNDATLDIPEDGVQATTTQCPLLYKSIEGEETLTTSPNITIPPKKSHSVEIYVNTKKNHFDLEFGLKYDDVSKGLTLENFDLYEDNRKFPNNTYISNLKVFKNSQDSTTTVSPTSINKVNPINFPIINDIYHLEYNLYKKNNLTKLISLDVTKNQFNEENISIFNNNPNIYYNILIQEYKRSIIFSMNYNNLNTELYKYDTLTNSTNDVTPLTDVSNKAFLSTSSIIKGNNIYFYGINGTTNPEISIKKITIEQADEDDADCDEGNMRNRDGTCSRCEGNTYSNHKNSLICKSCPIGMISNNNRDRGGTKCLHTDDYYNKTDIYSQLSEKDENVLTSMLNNHEIQNSEQKLDDVNIDAMNNNLKQIIRENDFEDTKGNIQDMINTSLFKNYYNDGTWKKDE